MVVGNVPLQRQRNDHKTRIIGVMSCFEAEYFADTQHWSVFAQDLAEYFFDAAVSSVLYDPLHEQPPKLFAGHITAYQNGVFGTFIFGIGDDPYTSVELLLPGFPVAGENQGHFAVVIDLRE